MSRWHKCRVLSSRNGFKYEIWSDLVLTLWITHRNRRQGAFRCHCHCGERIRIKNWQQWCKQMDCLMLKEILPLVFQPSTCWCRYLFDRDLCKSIQCSDNICNIPPFYMLLLCFFSVWICSLNSWYRMTRMQWRVSVATALSRSREWRVWVNSSNNFSEYTIRHREQQKADGWK